METIESIRENFENLGNAYPPASGISKTKQVIADVDCYWYGTAPVNGQPLLVYVHGGGFFLGSHKSHGAWTSYLAKQTQMPVLLIDYSLAPEHKFPIALNQVLAVLRELQVNYKNSRLGLIGDSAGGNIALAAAVKLKEEKHEQPSFNILISPWLDLECKNPSFEKNKAIDKDLTCEGLKECAQRYVSGKALSDPMLSPLNANLEGLKPFLVASGTDEILEDDSLILCKKLKAAGVPAEYVQFKDQGHSWSYYHADSEPAQRLFVTMAKFVQQQVTPVTPHP